MTITWTRGGRTASRWNGRGQRVRVLSRTTYDTPGRDVLVFRFDISAAGGGTTEIELCVEPDEFPNLIKLMRWEPTPREIALQAENNQLRDEVEYWKSRVLNESVRPDRVAEFRKKVLESVIAAVVKA